MKYNINWLYKTFSPPFCTAVIPLCFLLPLAEKKPPVSEKPLIWKGGGPVNFSIEANI